MSNHNLPKQAPDGTIYYSESVTQRACVRWFRLVHNELRKYLFSIPNGGKLGGKLNKEGRSVQASILVGEGLTSGVADLQLALPRSGFHSLFIEMKTPVGVWEEDQIEFARRQIKEGFGYALCRTREEFEKVVTDYLEGTYLQATIEAMRDKNAWYCRHK